MNLEALFNTPIKRKTSIQLVGAAGLAIVSGHALSGLARATEPTNTIIGADGREWIYANRSIPWSDVNWYPINPARGLPTLYGPNGPLVQLDDFAHKVYDIRIQTAQAERDLSNELMKLPGPYVESYGHCDALAAAGIFEPEPQAGGIEGHPKLHYSQSIRKGVLTAFYSLSGGIRLDPNDNENNINLIMQHFVDTGRPFVVEDPEDRGGMWFRAAYAVSKDMTSLMVTNIGLKNIPVPRGNIRWADIRFHPKLHPVEPKYQIYVDEVMPLEIPELHDNYKIVQHMVTGKAA